MKITNIQRVFTYKLVIYLVKVPFSIKKIKKQLVKERFFDVVKEMKIVRV